MSSAQDKPLIYRAWPAIRDPILFFAGLGIMLYETVGEHFDRPVLIGAALMMMGLPVFLPASKGTPER